MHVDKPSHIEDFSALILSKLSLEATVPVTLALTRFAHAPTPPKARFVCVSFSPPTNLQSTNTIESCYDLWRALPVPNAGQLTELRHNLSNLSTTSVSNPPLSLELVYASHKIRIPLWSLDLWPTLQSHINICRLWDSAKNRLIELVSKDNNAGLATQLLDQIANLPVNVQLPNLPLFRTSYIPDLIQDSWLSDDHINAGIEFINSHPHRRPTIYALNSFFPLHLERAFERSQLWCPRRPPLLDSWVTSRSIVELLIPVHRPGHWTLLHVDIKSRHYSYCDTINPATIQASQPLISLINCWLGELLGVSISLSSSPRRFPLGQQFDGHSCGVAILSTLANVAISGAFLPWSQKTALEHRLNWSFYFVNSASHPKGMTHPQSKVLSKQVEVVLDDLKPPAPVVRKTALLVQSKLNFKPMSREEWLAQKKQEYVERCEERKDRVEKIKLKQARKLMDNREDAKMRKRAERARKKTMEGVKGAQVAIDTTPISGVPIDLCARTELSALSRPYSIVNYGAKLDSNLTDHLQRGHKLNSARTQRVNWCHPLIWALIEKVARDVGYPWSPAEIVRRLNIIAPHIYGALRPQRISQWRDRSQPDILKWTDSHLRSISAGVRPFTGKRHRGILYNRPDIVQKIKTALTELRATGLALNLSIIRGYMVGIIQHYVPDAFARSSLRGRIFSCSNQFVRCFLRSELGWSIRKATRAAQKYPPDVDLILLHAFLRLVCVIRDEEIPASCIVNADQTQVVYSPGDQKTWNPTGQKQVNITGAEEKRAFTVLVAGSMSGTLLPLQAIYSGHSNRSLPDPSSPRFQEALDLCFRFHYSNSPSYWSTFKTMCLWVEKTLVPYFLWERNRLGLPSTQRCVLQLDCWSVHRSVQFRDWISNNHPWIILMFVPGGCTGLFQACDVGLQRVFKAAIQSASHIDIVEETVNALKTGIPPERVRNDQTIGTLRNRSVNWLLKGFEAINKPELVKKAFSLCAVPQSEFNLSYESLTSRNARKALLNLRSTNPNVYQEITSGYHSLPLSPVEDNEPEFPEDEGLCDGTVDEVYAAVLAARLSREAAPLALGDSGDDESESEYDYESEDDHAPAVLGAKVTSCRHKEMDLEE
ncbi:hypothetical protein RSOLAG1IB_12252 [Rhizoctonia solani AG-1 IB]|uniref:Ubiquitin-like protease family profile domain-containing protein n=1 Tax=Thanatephorus cucumeris (strain AG1-IB / isolate 7/3/14) TaxID=1108050 RepID=A0A0B7FQD6_THACB|nr:hypothetical protein RSOLAG1IB_12252 [Rhizoctonia solani AG-1 IB]